MRAAIFWMAGFGSLLFACAASDGAPREKLRVTESPNNNAGGSGSNTGDCEPFSEHECQCADDTFGTQLCNEDGQSYGECLDCGNPPSGGAGGDGGGTTEAGDLTGNISISEIAIYQSVKIPLMSGGTVQTANAPVVTGKQALVRVFVAPGNGWQAHQVVAELTLSDGGNDTVFVSDPVSITAASSDGSLGSSLNINVPGEKVTLGARYKVSIKEVAGSASAGGDTSGGTFPPDAPVPLAAQDPKGPLRIVIVPYRYLADGSGRMPVISDSQIERYRTAALALYPVSSVEVSVRATVDYSPSIGALDQRSWESWLNHLCSLRNSDNGNSKEYYWGIAAPATSWSDWGGGIAGLGVVPPANYPDGRCAVGLGFTGADIDGLIMVHEIGHNLGREHAPCRVNGPSDPSYPYSGAAVGSWGYDSRNGALKSPTSNKDFMSYCKPAWTSDYTYRGIFNRVATVNSSFLIVPDPDSPPTEYQTILISADDGASWGYPTTLEDMPEGATETVELLDATGQVTGTAEGVFIPFSHGGGQLLVPATSVDIRYVRVTGFDKLDVTLQPSLARLREQAGPRNLRAHVRPGHPSLN